ncbi:MAG TPA: hypothetical protein IGS52_17775 [Oscillatoriaceae cyanobacterium M33_DOE_052]|uniref:Uncharacterized protein n=1 Tax=Planktothricoides sp. SpSt-374 TaxID=2282167 RepID=A0A7C3ZNM7_9CYAN|nr:hypothetical protein [Oscillatoriaceae cyanobacterium M33_DOE_052]
MAIIALRAWYLREYEPVRELERRPHDLRLSKTGMLKTGLRADFLDELEQVKRSEWFELYLEGESVEFYIEGSGGYAVANVDLIGQEIYFTKKEVMARLEPGIYLCSPNSQEGGTSVVREAMEGAIAALNTRSRLELTLTSSELTMEGVTRPSGTRMRKLSKSLLFVADVTPIVSVGDTLIPSPLVSLELGYALSSKRREQILLVQQELPDLAGQLPFDLPSWQQLSFTEVAQLHQTLPGVLESQLQRYNLFS